MKFYLVNCYCARIAACFALNMLLMFHALLLAVVADLLANTRISFDILRIRRQQIRKSTADSLHFMYLGSTVRQFYITFLEEDEAMG